MPPHSLKFPGLPGRAKGWPISAFPGGTKELVKFAFPGGWPIPSFPGDTKDSVNFTLPGDMANMFKNT